MYEDINKTPCRFCGGLYNRGGGITSHEAACHRKSLGLPPPERKQDPQVCGVCKRQFKNPQALGSHKKTCIPVQIVINETPTPNPPPKQAQLVQSMLQFIGAPQTTGHQHTNVLTEEEIETAEVAPLTPTKTQTSSPLSLRLSPLENSEETPAINIAEELPPSPSQIHHTNSLNISQTPPVNIAIEPSQSQRISLSLEDTPLVREVPMGFRKIDCFHLYKLTTISLREAQANMDMQTCTEWTTEQNPFHFGLNMSPIPDQSALGPEVEEISKRFSEELVGAIKSNVQNQVSTRMEANRIYKHNYCDRLAAETSWDHVKLLLGLAKSHIINDANRRSYKSDSWGLVSKSFNPERWEPIIYNEPEWAINTQVRDELALPMSLKLMIPKKTRELHAEQKRQKALHDNITQQPSQNQPNRDLPTKSVFQRLGPRTNPGPPQRPKPRNNKSIQQQRTLNTSSKFHKKTIQQQRTLNTASKFHKKTIQPQTKTINNHVNQKRRQVPISSGPQRQPRWNKKRQRLDQTMGKYKNYHPLYQHEQMQWNGPPHYEEIYPHPYWSHSKVHTPHRTRYSYPHPMQIPHTNYNPWAYKRNVNFPQMWSRRSPPWSERVEIDDFLLRPRSRGPW